MGKELDKSRKNQYKQEVEENFPNEYGIINIDEYRKELGNMGIPVKNQKALIEMIEKSSTMFTKQLSCRYGQNPGGSAAFYKEEGASGPCFSNMKLLQKGKGLGYINIGDSDLGQRLVKSLYDLSNPKKSEDSKEDKKNIALIVKHEMPSGVARGDDSLETYEMAWGTDELSSFWRCFCFFI